MMTRTEEAFWSGGACGEALVVEVAEGVRSAGRRRVSAHQVEEGARSAGGGAGPQGCAHGAGKRRRRRRGSPHGAAERARSARGGERARSARACTEHWRRGSMHQVPQAGARTERGNAACWG